jgi:hypothetical protein
MERIEGEASRLLFPDLADKFRVVGPFKVFNLQLQFIGADKVLEMASGTCLGFVLEALDRRHP